MGTLTSHLSHFLPVADLSDEGRLYTLEGEGAIGELHVERWHADTTLSSLYRIQVDALANDGDLPLDDMLGKKVSLYTIQPDGSRTQRTGLVAEAQLLGSDGSLARYRLTLVPWLWLLDKGRHSRVFQDMSVTDILAKVLADYAPHAAWQLAPEVADFLSQVRPRSYAVQYRETDLAFVERLLAEEGLGYTFVEDDTASAGHQLLIFADSSQLPEDARSAQGGIRFHRAGATEDTNAIQALGQQAQLGPASVNLLSWDYKSRMATSASLPVNTIDGAGELYDPAGPYAFADSREAAHYAQLAAQALDAREHSWTGRGSVRGVRVGTRFHLANSPWDSTDLSAADATLPEGFVFTRLQEVGINNLPAKITQQAQAQLGTNSLAVAASFWQQAEATGYAQRFEAIDQTLPWRPLLADDTGLRFNPRPTAPGVQTAIVVGPEGETQPSASGPVHVDALGRVKVRFHWMDEGGSCWLRCTQRLAGNGYGAHFLPRIGQEVLVNFLGGDIDRPVVVGALYNGQGEAGIAPTPGGMAADAGDGNKAYAAAKDFQASAQGNLAGGASPAWHGQSADAQGHNNAAALSGIKTQSFDGAGYNQLVFDDSDGQGRIQMASSHAHTQLNLGHLIHQADNYRGSFRGTGLELRTDAQVALRASKGALLTTYGIAQDSPYADANAVGSLVKQHAQLAASLSDAAKTHRAVPLAAAEGTQGAHQSALNHQAAPLSALHVSAMHHVSGDNFQQADQPGDLPHSQDALTSLAGRAGIASVAADSLHLAAGETVSLGSGQHTNMGTAGATRWHASQAIGLLGGAQGAKGNGINLVASSGDVQLQAQHDAMALQSKADLNLASISAKVDLAAKQKIHLATAGGAFITIEGGNITLGCPGTLTIQAGVHDFAGGGGISGNLPSFPGNVCVECLERAAKKAQPFVTR